MAKVKVERLEGSIENLIITGMIVDDVFLQEMIRCAKPEYFSNDISRILCEWIREFAEENEQAAPGGEIKTIFDLNKDELDKDEAKTVRIFLNNILTEHEKKPFNKEYILPRALRHLEENAYSWKMKVINKHLVKGDLNAAKDVWENGRKDIFKEITPWKSFNDEKLLDSWWGKSNETLFLFSGELGGYMPNIEKGRLYAMLGSAKRGKSWWLLEWVWNAAFEEVNCAFFSLEMNEYEVDERWKKRLSALPISNNKSEVCIYPVVDCKYNQDGSCQRPECPNPGEAIDFGDSGRPDWEDNQEHEPCSICRERDDLGEWEPAHWLVEEEFPTLTKQGAIDIQKRWTKKTRGDRVKVKSFPIGSASVSDIERALDDLEKYENYMPELVAVDYAGIIQEDFRQGDKRHRVGEITKELSRLAKTRNIAIVTAFQGNRGSAKKARLTEEDVSEDWSQIMTIDGVFAINEDNSGEGYWGKDKNWQIQRIETIVLRYGKVRPGLHCITLNDMTRGQICMDSYVSY
jgi:hypothetical protein